MTANRSLFLLLPLCFLSVFAPQAMSQPDCQSIEYIEYINDGKLKRTAHINGDNAILFIALDPVFSAPEYDYGEHYPDEHFIESIRKGRKSLYNAGVDEIVVWKLPGATLLGAAIPFREGCAVFEYGEPDYHDKLMLMHKAFLQISKHGLDAPSVRDSIKKLIKSSRYSSLYKDEMVDIIINNLRPLMANTPPSDRSDNDSSHS